MRKLAAVKVRQRIEAERRMSEDGFKNLHKLCLCACSCVDGSVKDETNPSLCGGFSGLSLTQ